ncbi:glutamate receptor 2.6-like [Chenopodium quinoa]|uniref:glutamate receptor 2.6-like n=1 Tax=Chenopodium quinoa TaxID=63459 RepID=UPI000B789ADB|nr:glutamate receptor 2.6-like [Chenopodium quinoa]
MKNSGKYMLVLLFTMSLIAIHVTGQNSTGLTNQTDTTRNLRFLVPKRDLEDFVKVRPLSNGSDDISGFSIDVFRAAAKLAIPSRGFDLVPFTKDDRTTMRGTFDEMLQAVDNEGFDGAVGEITILSRRMQWVDFTLPYLDTEIGLLVRVQAMNSKELVALTPATKIILVLVGTLGFSILVAVGYWIWKLCTYKHATSSTQLSVLAILLVLMVLLLTIASYAPRQTSSSSLSTRRSDSKVKSLVDLKREGLKIGYRQGAFVKSMLVNKGGISETNLIELESEVEMLHKLQTGGEDGGIDAVVAGTHHLKLFQEEHCDEFTLVQDFRVKSAGLGFAFHKDQSPSFVNLFSEAIVKLIDFGNMTEIQEATIGDLDKICQETTGAAGGFRSTVEDRISIWLPVTTAIFVVVLVLVMLLSYCGLLCIKK